MSLLRGPFSIHKRPQTVLIPTGQPTLAILFGWTNGSLEHVKKYVQFYHERNLDVIIQLATGWDFLYDRSCRQSLRKYAKDLFHEYKVLGSLSEQRCVFHIFSNGGANSVRMLTEVLGETGSKLNVVGIVLDSNPGGFDDPNNGVIALSAAIQNPVWKLMARIILGFIMWIGYFFRTILGLKSPLHNASDMLCSQMVYPCPRLYLYSKEDNLIPWKDVEAHSERAKKNQLVVHTKRWEDSEHVQHFRKYPQEYNEALTKFYDEVVIPNSK